MTRVMVVDDHPMWRDAVVRDLAAAGPRGGGDRGRRRRGRTPGAGRPSGGRRAGPPAAGDVGRRGHPGAGGRRPVGAGAGAVGVGRARGRAGGRQGGGDRVPGEVGVVGGAALGAWRRTALGEAVFTPGLAGLVLGEYRRLSVEPAVAGSGPAAPRLTERETEVLRLVAKGLSYKQIAERLVISHRTVQNHVQNTLNKLQLHNRVELVRYAIEQGLDDEAERALYVPDRVDGLSLPHGEICCAGSWSNCSWLLCGPLNAPWMRIVHARPRQSCPEPVPAPTPARTSPGTTSVGGAASRRRRATCAGRSPTGVPGTSLRGPRRPGPTARRSAWRVLRGRLRPAP